MLYGSSTCYTDLVQVIWIYYMLYGSSTGYMDLVHVIWI